MSIHTVQVQKPCLLGQAGFLRTTNQPSYFSLSLAQVIEARARLGVILSQQQEGQSCNN